MCACVIKGKIFEELIVKNKKYIQDKPIRFFSIRSIFFVLIKAI